MGQGLGQVRRLVVPGRLQHDDRQHWPELGPQLELGLRIMDRRSAAAAATASSDYGGAAAATAATASSDCGRPEAIPMSYERGGH